MNRYSRVHAEIDLDAILHNMDAMRGNIAKDTKIMAVIKADGYGHGAVEIAETIEKLDYLYDPSKSRDPETNPDLRICVPGSVCGYDQSGHPSDRIYQRDGRKAFRCGCKYRQGLQDSFCN